MIKTWVHRKKTKFPTPWTSNIPKRYKQNTIKAELYRAKHISSNFTNEVTLILNKFKSAGYSMPFVNSAIHEFTTTQTNRDIEFIITTWLFEVKKKIVFAEIPYCYKNENSSKQSIKKFDQFTNDMSDVRKAVCSCRKIYIGETIRTVEARWDEHNNPMNKSNPSKHIKDNLDHVLNWSVLTNAP